VNALSLTTPIICNGCKLQIWSCDVDHTILEKSKKFCFCKVCSEFGEGQTINDTTILSTDHRRRIFVEKGHRIIHTLVSKLDKNTLFPHLNIQIFSLSDLKAPSPLGREAARSRIFSPSWPAPPLNTGAGYSSFYRAVWRPVTLTVHLLNRRWTHRFILPQRTFTPILVCLRLFTRLYGKYRRTDE